MISYQNYIRRLQEKGLMSKIEYNLLLLTHKIFGFELPPLICRSPLFAFGIIFGLLFFGIMSVGVIFLLINTVVYGVDVSLVLIPSFKQRAWHMISIGSFFLLVLLQIIKTDLKKEYCRYCYEILNANASQIKEMILVTFLFLFIFLMSVVLFEYKVIIYIVTIISLIVIAISLKEILEFRNVESWKKVEIKNISLNIEYEHVLKLAGEQEFYSLKAKYCYSVEGDIYCGTKVYIDQPGARDIFNTPHKYMIKKWLSRHTDIKYAYYNPSRSCESVLFKEVLFSSYILKLAFIVGAVLLIFVVHYYINWNFYFS